MWCVRSERVALEVAEDDVRNTSRCCCCFVDRRNLSFKDSGLATVIRGLVESFAGNIIVGTACCLIVIILVVQGTCISSAVTMRKGLTVISDSNVNVSTGHSSFDYDASILHTSASRTAFDSSCSRFFRSSALYLLVALSAPTYSFCLHRSGCRSRPIAS